MTSVCYIKLEIMLKIRSLISVLLVITLLFITPACGNNEATSRFESAQKESTQSNAVAVEKETIQGGELNRYFPKNKGAYKVIYTQEKPGLAQAKLKRDGQELALMSISDIANNPSAVDKFKQSDKTINNYPLVNQGSKATALLVNNRYQIKIISRSQLFDETDRKQWLRQFDLATLAQL